MVKIFNKLNIKQKIFIAILIPIATVIITTTISIYEKKDSINKLENFHLYYQYYQKISEIIHNIEIERKFAFTYIGENGDKDAKNQMLEQRKIINSQFKKLKSFFAKNPQKFDKKLINLINDNIDQLGLFRYNVDRLNLFLDIEQNFYTDIIYNLYYTASNIPAMSNNKYLSNQTLAYKYLIEAKEYLSLEAGLLSYIVKINRLSVKDINKLKYFEEFYKNNLIMFKYFVNKEIKEKFDILDINKYHSSIKLQNKLKKQNINKKINLVKLNDINKVQISLEDIDLEQEPDKISKKIAAIKTIENLLVTDILSTIKKEKQEYYNNLVLYVLSIVVIMVLVFGLGLKISKSIVEKILILEKGLISFLKYVKREEKRFKPIILNGDDEINHMAKIVNQSIKETAYYVELEVKNAKRMHSQIIEAEKMAQMGEMIGNIAHQWRQPLSMISTLSSSLSLKKEFNQDIPDKELLEKLGSINEYTQYLSETINTFRDFIKDKKELKVQTLQENIKMALGIINTVLNDVGIKLIDKVDYKDLIFVKIVSGELPQVLINIINNAKDAIKIQNVKNGWIKLTMEKQKDLAIITIEDNAGGIPNKIMNKIFEPYFTTKHQSQGTGLGLHMSYRIVTESLHGKIYVKNSSNGAIFFIEIPLNTDQALS